PLVSSGQAGAPVTFNLLHSGKAALNSEPFKMNRKAKGSRNEHRSMAILEATGYRCTRAPASLGVFDIVAIGSVDVLLLQVKTRDWPGTVEMESIKMFPAAGEPE